MCFIKKGDVSMKRFERPNMVVVHLSGEDVITRSICYGVTCPVYYCDDCVTCEGVFKCISVTCNVYDGG